MLSPIINNLNRPFWEGVDRGELVMPWCARTGQYFWPPGPVSPFSINTPIAWRPARPSGTLVGGIVYRRSFLPDLETLIPYAIGFVALDDGPRLQVHLQDPELGGAGNTGLRVEIYFRPLLPGWRPIPVAGPANIQPADS